MANFLKPLFGFIASSGDLLKEEIELPKMHISYGFYSVMKKFGYDFCILASVGHVIKAKPYGHSDT